MGRSARKGNASKAIGYLRVSTTDQHLGPEAQRAALDRWCAANGVDLVDVFVDHGVSGAAALDRRPALMSAVNALTEHGAGVLLVAKRDRLARDVMVAAMAERLVARAGAGIVTADGTGNGDTPEALLMRRMVDCFAEYERAIIRARTTAALAVKRAKGEKLGGRCPFGYHLAADGVHLEADDDEQRVISMVKQLRADGLSLRAVAAHLNDHDVPARGSKWHATTITRIMARAA
jgi:site-specific DNA recombinase